MRCDHYIGVACVNGSCPVANLDEYEERGYDLVPGCDECPYYKGCEDCGWRGDARFCPKVEPESEEASR